MPCDMDSPDLPIRRWQFSLRAALLGLFGLSVVLAIASQFPRESAFAVSMTLLILGPIAFVTWASSLFVRDCSAQKQRSTSTVIDLLLRPVQLLGQPDNAPPLLAGSIIALLSTLTLVGLWPLLREVGGTLTLVALQPIPDYTYSLNDATRSVVEAFSSPRYWFRLWQWELWAVGRWWLLFGTLSLVWLAAAAPFGLRAQKTRVRDAFARLLAFAPWFIVLEVLFLAGVWVHSPSTVPEPSTGFVVGIFSWDLWHWDCWLNREWLIRGALPTFAVGLVFFRRVLGWWWFAAVVAALCLIPVALTLSIASTVAFQNGFPPLF
jgi:hypothetical protein